ncbi:hypothetical protein ACVWXL_003529 [Bradyrhizobium sp. GM22.5]
MSILGPQHARAVREFARLHATEQVEVFIHGAIAERRVLAGLGQRAARKTNLLLGLVIDIGEPVADQLLRPFVEAVEIVRSEEQVLAPVEAEPAHVGLDGIDIFLLFLDRIGVVEAQMATARKLLGDAEIERDRLGVADMEITVRLRREPGHDLLVFGLLEVGLDDVTNEIAPNLVRHRFCHYENPVGKSAALLPNSLG